MEETKQKATAEQQAAFFSLISHPLKFRLYLLKNLPAAYFCGLRIVNADAKSCTVSVPFGWFTQNPFRSTYFACLSMAAEMSTGLLAMAHVYKRMPAVSMLVTGLEAKFYKKATGYTLFQCNDGEAVLEAISLAVSSGTAQTLQTHSTGKNKDGDVMAEFWVTWSFKAK